jgi:hypothetical protein
MKNLWFSFHKIKAHSNDTYNDMADELTKQELDIQPIIIQPEAYSSLLCCRAETWGYHHFVLLE